jgi:catechol 1,2-dioxygenase
MKKLTAVLLILAFVQLSFAQCQLTAKDILGPYYLEGSQFKRFNICTNTEAMDRLFVSGFLFDRDCKTPIPNAKMEVWQADYEGKYSTEAKGECRSFIMTDSRGFYQYQTIMPGRYDDGGYRPAHVHFKITAKDYGVFVTQQYFKNDHFLGDNDSCKRCMSGHPSLQTEVSHFSDIKTYVGKWNIYLAKTDSRVVAPLNDETKVYKQDSYVVKKDKLLKMNYLEELRKAREEIEALKKLQK